MILQVAGKFAVVFQPPQVRFGDDQELRSFRPHRLQMRDCRGAAVRMVTGVDTVMVLWKVPGPAPRMAQHHLIALAHHQDRRALGHVGRHFFPDHLDQLPVGRMRGLVRPGLLRHVSILQVMNHRLHFHFARCDLIAHLDDDPVQFLPFPRRLVHCRADLLQLPLRRSQHRAKLPAVFGRIRKKALEVRRHGALLGQSLPHRLLVRAGLPDFLVQVPGLLAEFPDGACGDRGIRMRCSAR